MVVSHSDPSTTHAWVSQTCDFLSHVTVLVPCLSQHVLSTNQKHTMRFVYFFTVIRTHNGNQDMQRKGNGRMLWVISNNTMCWGGEHDMSLPWSPLRDGHGTEAPKSQKCEVENPSGGYPPLQQHRARSARKTHTTFLSLHSKKSWNVSPRREWPLPPPHIHSYPVKKVQMYK